MNQTRNKLIYGAVLIACLIPLFILGQPIGDGGGGGQLQRMRVDYDIAEASLGEIDPSSETMKLASLGLRGVAATMLKAKAERYQREHEWDRHRATVNNLVRLQPHFERVWEYEAHNLTYNVSKEFDDYRQRYQMVREGSEFLIEGVRRNQNATRLVWYTGWFYGNKIGMADEKRQFRRLFSEDEAGHQRLREESIAVDSPDARGPNGKPDNWLVGRLWLQYGYDLYDKGVQIGRQTPLNYFETGPKWRLRHAEAIEKEGVLDESAVTAWQQAKQDWEAFGERNIPTTAPFTIQLGRYADLQRELGELFQEFRSYAPEAFDQARQNKISSLRDRALELYQSDPNDLPSSERELREKLMDDLEPNLEALLPQVPEEKRLRAVDVIASVTDVRNRLRKTRNYGEQVNYIYWDTLAAAEQEPRTVEARRLIFEAEKANSEARLEDAIDLYEQAFKTWAEIYQDYPMLTIDDAATDIYKSIRRYMIATDSEELPEDFPLLDFAILMREYNGNIPDKLYDDLNRGVLGENRMKLLNLSARDETEATADNTAPADADDATPADGGDETPTLSPPIAKAEMDNSQPASGDVSDEKSERSQSDNQPADDGDRATKPDGDADAMPNITNPDEPTKTDQSESDKTDSDSSKMDKPASDQPKSDKPKSDKPKSDEPGTNDDKTPKPSAEDKSSAKKDSPPKDSPPKDSGVIEEVSNKASSEKTSSGESPNDGDTSSSDNDR